MRQRDLRKMVEYMYKDEARSFHEMLLDGGPHTELACPSTDEYYKALRTLDAPLDLTEYYRTLEDLALKSVVDHIFVSIVRVRRFLDEED